MISLPDGLAEYAAQKRWVVWRYVRTAPDKKPTKVPYQPEHPRRKAKNNDPSTWSDFACASSACDAGGFDGVGVCIRGSDIAAFDVDDCRNAREETQRDVDDDVIGTIRAVFGHRAPVARGEQHL